MTRPSTTEPRDHPVARLGARLRDTPGSPQVLLRAFLGVTFTYAGLQKLTNRYFFQAANPGSIQAQLHASIATSPIGPLIRLAAHQPVLVGLLIAFGELAVGLGTLSGLLGRLAAAGGMAVSLLLFLSVSYNTTPYFYGSDIVFFFAWTPLVLGGSGAWSVDGGPRGPAREGTNRRRCPTGPAGTGPRPTGGAPQAGLRAQPCELCRRRRRHLGSHRAECSAHSVQTSSAPQLPPASTPPASTEPASTGPSRAPP